MSASDCHRTVLDVSKGNPGAARVLSEVYRYLGENKFSSVIQGLRVMEFSGPKIWMCYKDFAREDLDLFVTSVIERNQEMQEVVRKG